MTTIKVIAFLEVNLMDEFHTFECKHCEILHSLNVFHYRFFISNIYLQNQEVPMFTS